MNTYDEFETIPELTDNQKDEINAVFTPYIFYTKSNGTYHCICSRCGKAYETEFPDYQSPRHGSDVTCPECKASATLKHTSYGRKNLWEAHNALVVCPENENKVWLRAFYVTKRYNDDLVKTPSGFCCSEYVRYLLTPRNAACYVYTGGGYLKEKNILTAKCDCLVSIEGFENTFMRYHDIKSLKYDFEKFLCLFARYPITESLMKAGFSGLIEDYIRRQPNKRLFDWEASRLTDFFKTVSLAELKALDSCTGLIYSEKIKEFTLFKKAHKKSDVSLYNTLKRTFYGNPTSFLTIVNNYGLSVIKARNYILKQEKILFKKKQYNSLTTVIDLWKDYLFFAKKLSYDLENQVVIFPKDLKKAHDTAAKIVTDIVREEKKEKMKFLTQKLKEKYAFEYGALQIVVPESMQDIIDEGKALCHCVGGYAERHAKGTIAILFIRKKSDLSTPFVTMEVRGKEVVQYHGFRNDLYDPLPKEAHDFVKEFKQYIADPAGYKKRIRKKSA